MEIDDNFPGVFESIPGYGLVVSSKGIILQNTSLILDITNLHDLRGVKIQAVFPQIKSITRLHDMEFTHFYEKTGIRFHALVKTVESKKNKSYIVWLKDITDEYRQKKINKALLNISQLEIESKKLDQFYRTIQSELNNLFDASNLYIVLYDKFRLNLNLAYQSDKHNIQQIYPVGNTFALWVAQTGKAVVLNHRQIVRFQKKYDFEHFGPQAKCCMGVPLVAKNEVIGVIVVQDYSSNEAFSSNDLDILNFISIQIATSIQHKEYEEELVLAKEKAVESDKLKSAFLANMSHEIRTPMNAILGFSELVARTDLSADKRSSYTQHIVNNGKLLLTLVDDIIDLAKIEAGQLKIKRGSTNIDELLEELQHFCIADKKRLKKENVQIVRQQSPTGNMQWLHCDGYRLKQVLLNLLSNALKFTFTGSIEFGYIIPNNATIQFYVKDTGIGITLEQQSIIFDRFRQADNSATRQFGGTGLGLAISKKLVELMGGRIWVESEPNVGSTFFFNLPLIIPDLKNTQQDISDGNGEIILANFRGKSILIAEDNDANFQYLNELLKPTGLNIFRAINGIEAVDCIMHRANISLILMDMQLPEMDGFEATKKIKKHIPGIPIIAQTAYALSEEKTKALNSGCDYYLAKPIAAGSLLNLVNQILGNG